MASASNYLKKSQIKPKKLSYFTNFYKPQGFLIFEKFQKNGTKVTKFDKIWSKMASCISYYPEWGWKSFLFFLLLVLILNDTISQPGQFS